jgi:hypothetical protein
MHVRFGRPDAAEHSGDLTNGGRRRRAGDKTVTGVTRRPTIPGRRASFLRGAHIPTSTGLIPTDN